MPPLTIADMVKVLFAAFVPGEQDTSSSPLAAQLQLGVKIMTESLNCKASIDVAQFGFL